MALFTQAEIEALIQETGGVPVSAGGMSTYGHLDQVPLEALDGEVRVTDTSIVVATGALPELSRGAAVIVAGVERRVRFSEPERNTQDGLETRIWLYAPGAT